jgi:hypothetical protein
MSSTSDIVSAALNTIGPAGKVIVSNLRSQGKIFLWGARRLINPFSTVGGMIVLIIIMIILSTVIDNSVFKKVMIFTIIGTIAAIAAFIFIKIVPSPVWVATKPIEGIMYVLESIEKTASAAATKLSGKTVNVSIEDILLEMEMQINDGIDYVTAPIPQQQTAPTPQQQTAPTPQQQTAPIPQQQTAPIPQQQTAPIPQQQTAPNNTQNISALAPNPLMPQDV